MRTLLLACTLTLAVAWVAGCSSDTQPAVPVAGASIGTDEAAAVDAVYAKWRSAVEAADIPAYVSVLHPDVRMMPPGARVLAGSNSYAAFLQPVFAAADYKIEVTQMPIIEVMGDLAVAEYEYVIHLALKNAEEGVTEPGALTASRTRARYFDVLRKTSEGNWGVWRHTWRAVPDPE